MTTETTAMVITLFLDEETKSTAIARVAEIRSQGASDVNMTMIKAEEGPIVAHGKTASAKCLLSRAKRRILDGPMGAIP